MAPYINGLCRAVRRFDLRRTLIVAALVLVANQAAAIDVFVHATAPSSKKAKAVTATVALNERIFDLQIGEIATIRAPSGKNYAVTLDRVETGFGGTRTWIGHSTEAAKNFRVFISIGNDQVTASIRTPEGLLRLNGPFDHARLTNLNASGVRPLVERNHVHPTSPTRKTVLATEPYVEQRSVPAPAATIDLLLLYTNGYATKNASAAAVVNRLNQLVAIANQAFIDSGVGISLRAVGMEMVAYPDNDLTPISTALDDLTFDKHPNSPLAQYANGRRNRLGADLVTLVRDFKNSRAGACGTAWAYGGGVLDEKYGYSVLEDGTAALVPCGLDGDHHDFPHEIGHNLGAVHDACSRTADADTTLPTQSFNMGYCTGVNGFSTIMATVKRTFNGASANCCASHFYLLYANPAITTCGGSACGIPNTLSNGADNTTAFNQNGTTVAAYRKSKEELTSVMSIIYTLLRED